MFVVKTCINCGIFIKDLLKAFFDKVRNITRENVTNMNKNKKSERNCVTIKDRQIQNQKIFIQRYLLLLLVVLVCGSYAFIQHNKTMPFAEGWYSYYAQCINNGEIVYRDFDYLFPPFYIYLVALITRLFGYHIIVLRVFGVIVYCIIGSILYLVFVELFNSWIAFIAAVTATLYLQTEVVQVFYDYIRVMDVFILLSVLFLLKAEKEKNKSNIFWIIAGLSNAIGFLIKQNIGGVLFLFSCILVITTGLVTRTRITILLKKISAFIIGFTIPIALTCFEMIINDCLYSFIDQIGIDALNAKGGLITVLFGWFSLHRDNFVEGSRFAVVVVFVIIFAKIIRKRSKLDKRGNSIVDLIIPLFFGIFCIISFLIFAHSKNVAESFDRYNSLNTYSVFLIVLVLFAFHVVKVVYYFNKKHAINQRDLLIITITGSYIAISWGCGMSSGLSEGQSTIGVAFVVAYCIESINGVNYRKLHFKLMKSILIAICFLITLQSAAKKMCHPYSWWGMQEADYWDNLYMSKDIRDLDGIQMSRETLNTYETICNAVKKYSKPNDPIYCFPNIQIFYTLCNRNDPGVRAKVQWFDVSSDASLESDMQVIKDNPPKVIIIYDASDGVYEAHEHLFREGRVSSTRKMRDYLQNFVQSNNYVFYGRVTASENNSFLLYYSD